MKTLFSFLFIATGIALYAQNPLVAGIQTAGKIVLNEGETKSIVYNTSISFPDECTANYKFTQEWGDGFAENVSTYDIKWVWIDIRYIKIDRVLNVLELDTESKVIESSTDDKTHVTVKDDKQTDIGIYFKNIEDAEKAAVWVQDKVKSCGGSAILIQ